MRQLSNLISAVCEARQPSFSSLRTIVSPGVPPGTMNSAWPRWPSSGSTVALTTCTLAMPPLPIQILWPSITHSSPSRRARVRRLRTSLPPSGSDTQSAASLRSPGSPKHSGAHLSSCSGVAACAIADSASAGITMLEADPRAAPEQLLHEQRQREAGRIADQVAVEERVVEALLGGRLEHLPRELLRAVVVLGDRPDHVARERVRALDEVELGRSEREPVAHASRSTIATTPCPPAAQIETSARRAEPFARRAASRRWPGSARRWRRTGGRRPASRPPR